jgi:ADP-heptose:LPS heptosyltransferase
MQQLGAPVVTLTPRLTATREEKEKGKTMLEHTKDTIVILHPGASDTRRRWRPEGFAAVGNVLAQRGARIVITGTVDELPLAQHIETLLGRKVFNMTGKLSLSDLVGVCTRASLVVANDTGPMHLAVALGRPSIGLFASGSLFNWAPLLRETFRPVVSLQRTCPLCGTDFTETVPFKRSRQCDHGVSFVADIHEEDVLAAAEDLLASHSGSQSTAG